MQQKWPSSSQAVWYNYHFIAIRANICLLLFLIVTNASFWRQEQAKKKKRRLSVRYDSLQPASGQHLPLRVAVTPYTLDCSISFLLPQQTFFCANSYRTRRSTGSLLLCKKDLCSLRTKCADPLLKNRLFKTKTTIVSPHECMCIYICAERLRILYHDLGCAAETETLMCE